MAEPRGRIFLVTAPILLMATPVAAQNLGGGESPDISIWRILLALIVSLFVALGAIWLVYQRQRGGLRGSLIDMSWLSKWGIVANHTDAREIEIVDMRKLNQQTDVCLLRCQNRDYFILIGSEGPIVLHEQQSLVATSAQDTETPR